jgi:hypothetical protein
MRLSSGDVTIGLRAHTECCRCTRIDNPLDKECAGGEQSGTVHAQTMLEALKMAGRVDALVLPKGSGAFHSPPKGQREMIVKGYRIH